MPLINLKDIDNESSLRVRGTGCGQFAEIDNPRAIPACAGNGSEVDLSGRLLACHPCVCGEQQVFEA